MGTKRRSTPVRRSLKAVSLHIGLNSVEPKHYAGWSGELQACEADARDMAGIAKSQHMVSKLILTKEATRKRVLAEIGKAAKLLAPDELFLLTYSGHGGQVPDITNDEGDKFDETWCLYDGQLIDDELYLELRRFKHGVRILVLSDSCHSGTVVKMAPPIAGPNGGRSKFMPTAISQRTYAAHKEFYDRIQRSVEKSSGSDRARKSRRINFVLTGDSRLRKVGSTFGPSLILISGCQDNQTSMDGSRNGVFTSAVRHVWDEGAFTGDYKRFHEKIVAEMPYTQTPNLFALGDAGPFLLQRPFSTSGQAGRRVTHKSASLYLKGISLPKRRKSIGLAEEATPSATSLAFETAKAQAAVVGGSVISFVSGVTPERREAIVNSSLLAQLVASKQVTDKAKIYDWYNNYFDVLTNIGWVTQDRGFSEYTESTKNFETHKAILAVATTLLGPASTALAVVTSTINALHSMDESSPWITIFNRESQHARTARFQVSLAEQAADGQFFVNLMAFGLEANASITQVLFFKSKKSKVTFRYFSGRVTINTQVLDSIRNEIAAKLAGHAADFVQGLPDLSQITPRATSVSRSRSRHSVVHLQ